jgi:hypothetical protein
MMDGALQPELVETHLIELCGRMCGKLQKRNQVAGKITLALQFEDARRPIDTYAPKSPISSAHDICSVAKRLFHDMVSDVGIVSMVLTAHDLRSVCGVQLCILSDDERKMRLDHVLKNINRRFGDNAMTTASSLLMAG